MFLFFLLCVGIPVCLTNNVPIIAPVRCGVIPTEIFKCLKPPAFLPQAGLKKCTGANTDCDKLSCAFSQLGWIKDGKVLKEKVASHIGQVSYKHPAWTAELARVKEECVDRQLPPQGVFLDCPAYDISHCALVQFLKSSKPSHWEQDLDCQPARQYAALCPVCPEDCFAPTIPTGSCAACRQLPVRP